MSSFAGHLVVASPILVDPNFDRTVVLVIQHDATGCIGLVLNRLTNEVVSDHLPDWAPMVEAQSEVNYGGPVDPEIAIALGQTATGEPIGLPGVTLIDLESDPALYSGSIRIYSGYAGWDRNQLEEEIGSGAWYVVPASPDDPFRTPETLWRGVLRRQAGLLSVVSTYPDDASLN